MGWINVQASEMQYVTAKKYTLQEISFTTDEVN